MRLLPKTRNFSLQFHITTLFTTLIIISGTLLGWFSYTELSANMMQSGKNLFDASSLQVVKKIETENNHIKTMLKALSASNLTEISDQQTKMAALPVLSEMLKGTSGLAALFIAYDNDDFFLLKKVTSASVLNKFNAPLDSYFMMTLRQTGHTQHYFYDMNDKLLKVTADPDYNLNTKQRPWYKKAMNNDGLTATNAYLFHASHELGLTLALHDKQTNAVIGADYSLKELSHLLKGFKTFPNGQRMVVNKNRQVVAYQDTNLLLSENGKFDKFKSIQELKLPALEYAVTHYHGQKGSILFSFENKEWLANVSIISTEKELHLFQIVPTEELLADAYLLRYHSLFITLGIILATLPLAWYFARLLTAPISGLTKELDRINNFDFSTTITTKTPIKEIDELISVTNNMKETISHFQDLSASLVSQQNIPLLLAKISSECNKIPNVIGTLIVLNEYEQADLIHCNLIGLSSDENKITSENLADMSMFSNIDLESITELQNRQQKNSAIPQAFNQILEQKIQVAEPLYWRLMTLQNRTGKNLGTIAVIESSEQANQGKYQYAQAIADFSALAIQSQQLLAEQKHLLESFILLIAGAIDSKSPYTGGHCARVPELTKMLTHAACQAEQGAYKDFDLDDNQWEELHIAAWLHDCGKIVTPEYVIDKATKLETIYDRINEIRMRFELLKSDAHTHYWKSLYEGGDPSVLSEQREAILTTLDQEFEFVAECNIGGEFMSDDKIAMLQKIAQRTWTRTLDNKLGIAPQVANKIATTDLPVQEALLADKAEHLVEREFKELTEPGNQWGFQMKTPEYRFNRGELYNLAIKRGTLTEEDRFIINGHMVHTIVMLSKLPFPEHLQNVPTIAGGHHEKMDGTGYPKATKAAELPITARIMVVADIFEALTAYDRPYKERKTLSQSIKIMSFMVKEDHIDPDVFALFLTSGTYLEYAKQYLSADQIDHVDISQYL